MTQLTIYQQDSAKQALFTSSNSAEIKTKLDEAGIWFEQWPVAQKVGFDASQDEILNTYKPQIEQLKKHYSFKTMDVISLTPDTDNVADIRKKFLDEHYHTDHEVRFFVAGSGEFFLHIKDNVYKLLCEQGDLLDIPANTKHWFDCGLTPKLMAIRFFIDDKGWVATFTGDKVADQFINR